jgi:hypothetical protein
MKPEARCWLVSLASVIWFHLRTSFPQIQDPGSCLFLSKNGRVTVTQTNVLLMNSQQIGHHRVIHEEYTNNGGIYINYNAIIQFMLVKTESDLT